MQLVHENFMDQIGDSGLKLHHEKITLAALEEKIKQGGIPLVMISSYSYTRNKASHWVMVSGIDDTFLYVHDPDEDEDSYRSRTDNIYLPIAPCLINLFSLVKIDCVPA